MNQLATRPLGQEAERGATTHTQKRDHENIWQWYQGVYPRAMQLVPSRRIEAFVGGILGAYEDGKLWFL